MWDMESERMLPLSPEGLSAVFSDDSSRLVIPNRHHTLDVYDIPSGRRIATWSTFIAPKREHPDSPHWLESPSQTVFVSPNDRLIAWQRPDTVIAFYDPRTQRSWILDDDILPCLFLGFMPHGRSVLFGYGSNPYLEDYTDIVEVDPIHGRVLSQCRVGHRLSRGTISPTGEMIAAVEDADERVVLIPLKDL